MANFHKTRLGVQMILPYQEIKLRCYRDKLIHPWVERTKAYGMTYGLSAAGYDVRIDQWLYLTPGVFLLGSTVEHFDMPDDLIAQVCDKSTLARQGIAVQNTIIEPGWRGYLTLEITNHSKEDIVIKKGMPIAQIIFTKLLSATKMPYEGKYQDQRAEPVQAILEANGGA